MTKSQLSKCVKRTEISFRPDTKDAQCTSAFLATWIMSTDWARKVLRRGIVVVGNPGWLRVGGFEDEKDVVGLERVL